MENIINNVTTGLFKKNEGETIFEKKLNKISFSLHVTTKKHKTYTSKEMLQKLSIALAQVKACNTSKSLLNETRQIIYSLC